MTHVPGTAGDSVDAREARRAAEIRRYLATGEYDLYHAAWPGNVFESGKAARSDLLAALLGEVRRRASRRREGRATSVPLSGAELEHFARRKLEPMVRGLFPRIEQKAVLALLERSVVVLTDDNVDFVLRESSTWLRSSWTLANLYLESIGAELLSDYAPRIVGLSKETTCYVSAEYFRDNGKFSDFIVHEAAHIFHNCKRRTVGLAETRKREWLLEIEFRKRETFAYACEAWSRIIELSKSAAERRDLINELEAEPFGADEERVEPGEVVDILRDAVRARNGWKRILARCASRGLSWSAVTATESV